MHCELSGPCWRGAMVWSGRQRSTDIQSTLRDCRCWVEPEASFVIQSNGDLTWMIKREEVAPLQERKYCLSMEWRAWEELAAGAGWLVLSSLP